MNSHEALHAELAALEKRIHRALGQDTAIAEFNHASRIHARLPHDTHRPADYRPLATFAPTGAGRQDTMTEQQHGPEVIIKSTPKRPKAVDKGPRALTKYEEAGVPKEWLNDKGRFKGPGLDARYKSQLITQALKFEAANPKAGKTSPAHKMLATLEWTAHLDKSRASRKAKADRKPAKVEA